MKLKNNYNRKKILIERYNKMNIIMWTMGFIGGLSLGAILSSNDNRSGFPIVWVVYLILSILSLLFLVLNY